MIFKMYKRNCQNYIYVCPLFFTCPRFYTYCYEPVSFGSARLGIHYQLNVVDLAEGLEYAPEHVLSDVEVK